MEFVGVAKEEEEEEVAVDAGETAEFSCVCVSLKLAWLGIAEIELGR